MSRKLSKAIRHGYGVGPPSRAEIKEIEDGMLGKKPVDLGALIAKSKANANIRLKRPKNGSLH